MPRLTKKRLKMIKITSKKPSLLEVETQTLKVLLRITLVSRKMRLNLKKSKRISQKISQKISHKTSLQQMRKKMMLQPLPMQKTQKKIKALNQNHLTTQKEEEDYRRSKRPRISFLKPRDVSKSTIKEQIRY